MSAPKVGIGILIFRGGKVLLGKRLSKLDPGKYQTPGGALDNGESLEDCARREVREETGLDVANVRFQMVANIPTTYAPDHHVQIGFVADWVSGEAMVTEPDKCESWDWYDLDALPAPLFDPTVRMLRAYRSGTAFVDA